jgi:hypothetical protein
MNALVRRAQAVLNDTSIDPQSRAVIRYAMHPKALANAVKHLAFTRCGEFNLYGMIDAQIVVVEDKLLAGST